MGFALLIATGRCGVSSYGSMTGALVSLRSGDALTLVR
jgi:hypothetical protein